MKKDKLMILGAGLCQVPIITKAQRMGFKVIAVSIGGDYPGLSTADKAYEIDVRDKDRILGVAQDEEICGILTDQTDIPVTTVAYVAEHMGLPGIGYECASRFTNKYLMRKHCAEIGIPVPRFSSASSLEDAREKASQLGLPIMVKPVDSQGSRGVTVVNDLCDLDDAFYQAQSLTPTGTVILEEYFQGTEIVIQGFVSDYCMTNLIIGDRFYFDIPNLFVPKQTLFPSLLPIHLQTKILDMNIRLIESMSPKFGITHSEYLVNTETGDVCLVETAIRGGGVFISSDLIPLACGIDVNDMIIRLATGRNGVSLERQNIKSRASGYVCFTLQEGIIRKIEGVDALESLKGVHRAYVDDLFVGKKTGKLTNKTMRLGPILIHGSTRSDLNNTISEIQRTLQVEVESTGGAKSIVW